LQLAQKVAVATFWDMLHDFVGLHQWPRAWLAHIGSAHPFLCTQADPAGTLHLRVIRLPDP
jgi:hypothetical protein